jgi:hypothetical protein
MKPKVTLRHAICDPALLGTTLQGESWRVWRILLVAAMGERLSDQERDIYRKLTNRPTEPLQRVEEFWGIAGRRGGKTRSAAVLSVYLAALCDHKDALSPGEPGIVMFLAENTKQANVAFSYATAIFDSVPALGDLVVNRTADTLSLVTGVNLEIRAASFRGLRGVTCVAVVADECAYWYSDEASANADSEILAAVRPALLTTQGPLIVISSPYAKRGEVYATYRAHYGSQGDPRILVAHGTSRDFNPSLPQAAIDRALASDYEKASAEYLGMFRGDIESFISREAVEACISSGCYEREPVEGVAYVGFCDPSGGSNDSMTLAIAHREKDAAVLDCARERKAPFSPDDVVSEFAEVLRSYKIGLVRGDKYAGEWPRERFGQHGIEYRACAKTKSESYLALLPCINSRRVDLLDNVRLINQLCSLERRTGRGRDSVDHRDGAHDDVANAVAGAIDVIFARSAERLLLHDPIGVVPRRDAGMIDAASNPTLGEAAAIAASGPSVCPANYSPWDTDPAFREPFGGGGGMPISLAHLGVK